MPRIPGGGAPPTTPLSTTTPAAPAAPTGGVTAVDTPPAGPIDVMDSTGGSAAPRGMVGKLKHKLVERTWKELTKEHSARVANVSLGDHGAFGVRLLERAHPASSAFVQDDPTRAATTAKLQAETGKSVFWLESGGVMDANVGLHKSVPVGGLINVQGGFSTRGALEYRALHPYPADFGDAAGQLFKDHTVELPVDAARAKALAPGARVQITGRGSATVSSGIGLGTSTTAGSFTGSLGGSLSASSTRQGVYALDVTRLDGDKVRVVLSEVNERRRAASAALSAGVSVDGDALVDDTLDGRLDATTEDVGLDGAFGDIAGVGDEGLSGLLQSAGASALESVVKKYTAFHASYGKSATETRRDVTSYVLDLANPEAQKAYDELLRLDERAAAKISERSGSGVSRHVYAEVETGVGRDANVRFAGKKLLLFRALRAEREGTLTTAGGTQLIRTSRYERRYSGAITGTKEVKWEGVRVAEAGNPRGEHFFHLRFSKDDKITHNSEIRSFVRFADALGVKDADERRIVMPDSNWVTRLFGSDDNTRVRADVYFTDEGVRRIANADLFDTVQAYVTQAGRIDPDLADLPIGDPAARSVLRRYYDIESELEKLTRFPGDRDTNSHQISSLERDQRKLASEYQDLGHPKKELKEHALCLRSADTLAAHLGQMYGTDGDDAAWAKVFGDLGQSKKFEYMETLATLALLGGDDGTLVHDVSLEGAGVKLRAVDEGTLTHPDAAIADATLGHT